MSAFQFPDTSLNQINDVMQESWEAFHLFKNTTPQQRADLMRSIATEIETLGHALIETAMGETHISEARLINERSRTVFQLRSYADACQQGHWLEARINRARPPQHPDIRKMNIALGPVVVFGASNFPFAYSTAGGDTACALAAGCTVVVKAHPAHAATSTLVAGAIARAVKLAGLPAAIFTHVYGQSFEVGKALVMHPHTCAVGFTGSFSGGKQLQDWAQQRPAPIPVFAEMGSINPVFILPKKLEEETETTADTLAKSITLGMGQFCTNPGLMIGIKSEALDRFIEKLKTAIAHTAPATMLHAGIALAYAEKKAAALKQEGVELISESAGIPAEMQARPAIATVDAAVFMRNHQMQEEVFGPYSLLVQCNDEAEMLRVAQHLQGQLTATVMATEDEAAAQSQLLSAIQNICGRFIFNGVPTGVEPCLSMQHGGPYPATTDSRFTAVGADGIKRFVRPQCYQNWPEALLPEALKDANPWKIERVEA